MPAISRPAESAQADRGGSSRRRPAGSSLEAVRRRIIACRRCPELRAYCLRIAREKKPQFEASTYWGKPVPSIGHATAPLLIMGLAPAAHGGNRTGRMFTGDGSAVFLARALYRAGFATQPTSVRRGDGFELKGAFMSAALRCAPPGNRPTPTQLARCADHLRDELDILTSLKVVLALGKIGFDNIYARLRERGYSSATRPRFGHAAEFRLSAPGRGDIILMGSYHPSRQNTNTGLLTQTMLNGVFLRARWLLDRAYAAGCGAPIRCCGRRC